MPALYLERYAYPQVLTDDAPNPHLGISVVIPCYNEPSLLETLKSLKKCLLPACAVEVLVLINEPEKCQEKARQQNQHTYEEAVEWAGKHGSEQLKFLIFYIDNLPVKHAGVGLARKIGMDEAVRRFYRLTELKRADGIIVCLDADSICNPNYFQALETHFIQHPETPGCTIHYEHPLEGELSPVVYQGIIKYELYLRYYVHALRYAGFPYAFQTIGSSMAVRLRAYVKQGGMNRKKAGEDFYFLHKIIPMGNFTELTATTVIPSPRISDRVPFGTGKAIGDWVFTAQEPSAFYPAYHPQTFVALKECLDHLDILFELPEEDLSEWLSQRAEVVQAYLRQQHFDKEIKRIRRESSNLKGFRKKFFEWLNAFSALKFVHFSRDQYYADIPVEDAAQWLLAHYHGIKIQVGTDRELLSHFRAIDKGNPC